MTAKNSLSTREEWYVFQSKIAQYSLCKRDDFRPVSKRVYVQVKLADLLETCTFLYRMRSRLLR